MTDQIIIADPSRTVRTLAKLAFQDTAGEILEVTGPEDLAGALARARTGLLLVDEAWISDSGLLGSLSGAVSAVVVLGGPTCHGVPWPEALGLDPTRVVATPKPVSRASVREAANRITGGAGSTPAASGDLRALVAEEVSRAIGEEVRSVVWRIVPELAERLIKEELERLLKDDEGGEE